MEKINILDQVHKSVKKKILYLSHAVRQISNLDRMITISEIRAVIFEGAVIEDYPEDSRGHSCLILGFGEMNRPIHVVCSPKEEYLAIITAYLPNKFEWDKNFSKREKL